MVEDQRIVCYVIMNQSDDNPRNYQIDIGVDMSGEAAATAAADQSVTAVTAEAEDEELESDSDSDDEEHPIPCECERIQCVLIAATCKKYDEEAAKKVQNTIE